MKRHLIIIEIISEYGFTSVLKPMICHFATEPRLSSSPGSSVDNKGRVQRINFNNATRDSVLDLPVHQVQPFYRALRKYVDIMNRPENIVTYKMEPGEQTVEHVSVQPCDHTCSLCLNKTLTS